MLLHNDVCVFFYLKILFFAKYKFPKFFSFELMKSRHSRRGNTLKGKAGLINLGMSQRIAKNKEISSEESPSEEEEYYEEMYKNLEVEKFDLINLERFQTDDLNELINLEIQDEKEEENKKVNCSLEFRQLFTILGFDRFKTNDTIKLADMKMKALTSRFSHIFPDFVTLTNTMVSEPPAIVKSRRVIQTIKPATPKVIIGKPKKQFEAKMNFRFGVAKKITNPELNNETQVITDMDISEIDPYALFSKIIFLELKVEDQEKTSTEAKKKIQMYHYNFSQLKENLKNFVKMHEFCNVAREITEFNKKPSKRIARLDKRSEITLLKISPNAITTRINNIINKINYMKANDISQLVKKGSPEQIVKHINEIFDKFRNDLKKLIKSNSIKNMAYYTYFYFLAQSTNVPNCEKKVMEFLVSCLFYKGTFY